MMLTTARELNYRTRKQQKIVRYMQYYVIHVHVYALKINDCVCQRERERERERESEFIRSL